MKSLSYEDVHANRAKICRWLKRDQAVGIRYCDFLAVIIVPTSTDLAMLTSHNQFLHQPTVNYLDADGQTIGYLMFTQHAGLSTRVRRLIDKLVSTMINSPEFGQLLDTP